MALTDIDAQRLGNSVGDKLGNRNLIINGAMTVAQRGTSFTGVNATAYHCDRHQLYYQNSSAAFTVTQATDTPNGFGSSLKIDVTTADASTASNEEIKLIHKIEGFNLQGTEKGTANAKKLTLSFYIKATKTGTYIVELFDRDNSRDISASYTVSNTNWNRYTLTFPADTAGNAFDNNNASSLEINWWLVAGSAVQGGSLNTAWRATADSGSATGQVNFADNTANDWLITGVQLELGNTATPFEHRSYGDEEMRCRRYYQQYGGNTTHERIGNSYNHSSSQARVDVPLSPPMRSSPTLAVSAVNHFSIEHTSGSTASTNLVVDQASPRIAAINVSCSSGLTAGQGSHIMTNNNIDARLKLSAEL